MGVDVIETTLKSDGRRRLRYVAGALGLAFCAVMFVASAMYFWEAWEEGWSTSSLWRIPLWIPMLPMPIGFGLLCRAGFDPYWFAVVLTTNMEAGLITPPVGLNLVVINAIAPQVPTSQLLWDSLPYVLLMLVGILILCFVPRIATWLPDQVLGPL